MVAAAAGAGAAQGAAGRAGEQGAAGKASAAAPAFKYRLEWASDGIECGRAAGHRGSENGPRQDTRWALIASACHSRRIDALA
jgi:hypothetical protein